MGIKSVIERRYEEYLDDIEIYEDSKSIRLAKIVINKDSRGLGIGSKVLKDLVEYSDMSGKVVVLTPSSDFGGDRNRLFQFYKKFGFKPNKGYFETLEYDEDMVRYPKQAFSLNEVRKVVREVLQETFKVK
jgi:GNAT superfamily N-acetyltransferase